MGLILALACVLAKLGLVACAPPTANATASEAGQSESKTPISQSPSLNYASIPPLDLDDHVLLSYDNETFEEVQNGVHTGIPDPSTSFANLAYTFQSRLTVVLVLL